MPCYGLQVMAKVPLNRVLRAVFGRSFRHGGAGQPIWFRELQRWKTWIVLVSTSRWQFTSLMLLFVLSAAIACIQFEAVGGQFEDPAIPRGILGRLVGRLHVQLAHGRNSDQDQGRSTLEANFLDTRTPNMLPEEVFSCDRSHWRSDVCMLKGDVRMNGKMSKITLLTKDSSVRRGKEFIKAFPGKKDPAAMENVTELALQSIDSDVWASKKQACSRNFELPAVVFSMGGLPDPGNEDSAWADFNNILVPLYLTTYSYERMVVLVVHQAQDWFLDKYKKLLDAFTVQPILRLEDVGVSWCFKKVIVGLQSKGPLYVPGSVEGQPPNPQDLLKRWGRSLDLPARPPRVSEPTTDKLVLGIMKRKTTRMITAEAELRVVAEAEDLGFEVQLLELEEMSLERTFESVQHLDALLGVVGVELTNLLFLRPNSVLINIVPWGCEPRKWDIKFAVGMHLQYVEYLALRGESSLIRRFTRNHTAFVNPKRQWDMDPELLLSQNLNLTAISAHDVLTQAKYLLTTPEEDRI